MTSDVMPTSDALAQSYLDWSEPDQDHSVNRWATQHSRSPVDRLHLLEALCDLADQGEVTVVNPEVDRALDLVYVWAPNTSAMQWVESYLDWSTESHRDSQLRIDYYDYSLSCWATQQGLNFMARLHLLEALLERVRRGDAQAVVPTDDASLVYVWTQS